VEEVGDPGVVSEEGMISSAIWVAMMESEKKEVDTMKSRGENKEGRYCGKGS
jgi:hypothetical protein